MQAIKATDYTIYFQEEGYIALNNYIATEKPSSIVILVDTNTKRDCLPVFKEKITTNINTHVITINAGEKYKNIETCTTVWQQLTDLGVDRNALQINLGGGMLSDLGSFVASTYKRGITFINIPTTLLSMVDASVGGKTGVDLGNLKNLIGLFSNPKMVLVDTFYLKTLSEKEMHSGMAEVIKYGIVYDKELWNEIVAKKGNLENLQRIIHRSIAIKNTVVQKDPKEKNVRKSLNFGHTIGHAIESYFLASKEQKTLTHGEAIAIGMVVELYISSKLLGFPKEDLLKIKKFIARIFDKVTIPKEAYTQIIDLLKYDKKNTNGTPKFVLLHNIADFQLDCTASEEIIIEGFDFYSI